MASFRRSVCALLPFVLQAACRSAIPEQVLSKPSPAAATTVAKTPTGALVPRPGSTSSAYTVDQSGRIRIEEDSLARVDSVATRTGVTFATSQGGRFAGHITSFNAVGAGSPSSVPPGLVFPLPFSGRIDAAGAIKLELPTSADPCASPAPPVILTSRDLWFRLPDTVRVGTRWEDSSTTSICRDGIALHSHVHRTYHVDRVDARDSGFVLVVSRDQRMTLDGTGSQWGEAVRVSGTGSGQMMLSLAARTGIVLEATGRSTLDLTFTSARRTQRVRQSVATSVQAAPIK